MTKTITKEKVHIHLDLPPYNASEIDIALFLTQHIDHPCGSNLTPDRIEALRNYYIRIAKETLNLLDNEGVKNLIADKIEQYRG